MKILFLDIDGVLNRCGKSAQGLEEDKVLLLKSIVEQTGCEIVLSSTWRKSEHNLERIKLLCRQRLGCELFGTTPIMDRKVDGLWRAEQRGTEIANWLEPWQHKNPRFVILDDDADMGDLLPHLVKTDSFTGLTAEIAAEVIARFNNAEPK